MGAGLHVANCGGGPLTTILVIMADIAAGDYGEQRREISTAVPLAAATSNTSAAA
jgi:hypothetical protein